jgi:hypothetical protein
VSVYEKLDALHITLPELTPPVVAFFPFLRTGNLLLVSSHIAKNGGKPWVGQLGVNRVEIELVAECVVAECLVAGCIDAADSGRGAR